MPTATDTKGTTTPLWIGAHEAPAILGIPSGTIRSQASRGRLLARGLDGQDRPLYAVADIRRLNPKATHTS